MLALLSAVLLAQSTPFVPLTLPVPIASSSGGAAAAPFNGGTIAGALNSTVASGSDAVILTSGAYIDFAGGASGKHLRYNVGSGFLEASDFLVNGALRAQTLRLTVGGIQMPSSSSIDFTGGGGTGSLHGDGTTLFSDAPFTIAGDVHLTSGSALFATKGVQPQAQTLDTCAAGLEGREEFDSGSGVATGHQTRICRCISDGSSTYTWRNTLNPILGAGTATTCGD